MSNECERLREEFEQRLDGFYEIRNLVFMSTEMLGTVVNAFTCIVFIVNKTLHTPVNFYLLNLAIADIIMLLSDFLKIYPLPLYFWELKYGTFCFYVVYIITNKKNFHQR